MVVNESTTKENGSIKKELAVTPTKVEEPVQVMTKDSKKVAVGKRLAEYNHRKKEELAQESKAQESEPKLTLSQAYGIGAVMAVGVLDFLGYHIYQSKKGDNNATKVKSCSIRRSSGPKTCNKFEVEQSIKWIKEV